MFLLDTDAFSELEKPLPNSGFVSWLNSVDWLDLHLSVITLAEIWNGIASLPHGSKRRGLEAMFEMIPSRFHNRIHPVDYSVAVLSGDLQARFGPLPILDSLIASTAITQRLTLVTHNVRDMGRTGVAVLDPWT